MTEKKKFTEVAECLLTIDQNVLVALAKQMEQGGKIEPKSDSEKACFQVIRDLDIVGGKVFGR